MRAKIVGKAVVKQNDMIGPQEFSILDWTTLGRLAKRWQSSKGPLLEDLLVCGSYDSPKSRYRID